MSKKKKTKKPRKSSQVTFEAMRRKVREIEGRVSEQLHECAINYVNKSDMEEAWQDFSLELVPEEYKEAYLKQGFFEWMFFEWDSFEDKFLDEILTIAQIFLLEEASDISQEERKFVKEIFKTKYSFYVVYDVVPGRLLKLRDLMLGKEVTVLEKQAATKSLLGAVMFTRVFEFDGNHFMYGTFPVPLPPSTQFQIIGYRDDLLREFPKARKFTSKLLSEVSGDLRHAFFSLYNLHTENTKPKLHNKDGHKLIFNNSYYSLHCSAQEIGDILCKKDSNSFEKQDQDSTDIIWTGARTEDMPEDQFILKGNLRFKDSQLVAETNSIERADELKEILEKHLGGKITYKTRSITPMNESNIIANASQTNKPQSFSEEENDLIKSYAKKYWEDWFDIPIPALNDMTPREAAKTKKGRELLEILLIEYQSNANRTGGEGFLVPDIAKIEKELFG